MHNAVTNQVLTNADLLMLMNGWCVEFMPLQQYFSCDGMMYLTDDGMMRRAVQ